MTEAAVLLDLVDDLAQQLVSEGHLAGLVCCIYRKSPLVIPSDSARER